MFLTLFIFFGSLILLLFSAKVFTNAAEYIGRYLKLSSFVIGIFIVGIGTSLPELSAGILSVRNNVSEILSGNIIGANISNILLITGLAVILNRKTIILNSSYIYIDLHFLLGSFIYFYIIAFDGLMEFAESIIGILIFIVYSIYLIKGNKGSSEVNDQSDVSLLARNLAALVVGGAGIYFGADLTISGLEQLSSKLGVSKSLIALTVLSLGTTLPEVAVNIAAIRNGNAEMALGNTLGSCIFNTLIIPPVCTVIGKINVAESLLGFSLPLMAACGLLFYLLAQDKRISVWEGIMLVCLYVLFLIKVF